MTPPPLIPSQFKAACRFLPLLESLVGIAFDIPLQHFQKPLEVQQKSDATPVTIADRNTEQAMRQAINKAYPDHAIQGEEFGLQRSQQDKSPYQWVIDPIDGTRSFICGLPLWGSLIGLLYDDKPILGLVAMPALGEVFVAINDDNLQACWKNAKPISTSNQTSLKNARLSCGEGNKILTSYPELLPKLIAQTNTFRFIHDCYAYALLASGYLDAVIESDLQAYDILPIIPIIQASGGVISDWQGNPINPHLNPPNTINIIAASTPELHQALTVFVTNAII